MTLASAYTRGAAPTNILHHWHLLFYNQTFPSAPSLRSSMSMTMPSMEGKGWPDMTRMLACHVYIVQ